MKRWLRQPSTGRLVIDKAAIAAEDRLDGTYLLSACDQHMSAAAIALGYKNLLDAERGFRDMKSTLMLRPVFHRLEPRIRAHVLICWLALLLVRVAEQATEPTAPFSPPARWFETRRTVGASGEHRPWLRAASAQPVGHG